MMLVILACMIGSGLHCHKLGKRAGIEGTLEYLKSEGLLDYSD